MSTGGPELTSNEGVRIDIINRQKQAVCAIDVTPCHLHGIKCSIFLNTNTKTVPQLENLEFKEGFSQSHPLPKQIQITHRDERGKVTSTLLKDNPFQQAYIYHGIELVLKALKILEQTYGRTLESIRAYLQSKPIFIPHSVNYQFDVRWAVQYQLITIKGFDQALNPIQNTTFISVKLGHGECIITCYPQSFAENVFEAISDWGEKQGQQFVVPSSYGVHAVTKLVQSQYLPSSAKLSLHQLSRRAPLLFDGPNRTGLSAIYKQLPSQVQARRKLASMKIK